MDSNVVERSFLKLFRRVFFVDNAHFVMWAFLGMLWCFERFFLKSSSRRKRYNVLDAYSVKGTELITLTNDAYINSDTLVELILLLYSTNNYPVRLSKYQKNEHGNNSVKK